ncbi:universal stress protein [Nonomuraea fastidiosa]|uniref:universal stress protein n=1 Tax=Nonomuraea TaxID=83681 RepID=UPI00324B5E69
MSRPIVVGVDGSTPSHAAVEWAAADARRRRLPLRLVHVCEQRRGSAEGLKYCEGTLEAAADRARAAGAQEVVSELLEGNVVEALLGQAVTGDCVVLGSRGVGGFAGLALGSVGLAVAGHAEGPVVVVRAGAETAGHGKIVVGDDGSDTAREALRYAVEQARARDATLLVVYAWSQPMLATYGPQFTDLFTDTFDEDRDAAQERLDIWASEYPDVRFEGSQVRAHPVAALADASASAELVVVGSRGRGGFAAAVLGSVSHGLLHHAVCPVAVVRPRTA